MLKLADEKTLTLIFSASCISIRAFCSATPVDVVVLCEFPLSLYVCYNEDHDQLPIAKYLIYMK